MTRSACSLTDVRTTEISERNPVALERGREALTVRDDPDEIAPGRR
jgi:hypothetical protein